MSRRFSYLAPLAITCLSSLTLLASRPAYSASVDVDSPTPYLGIGINQLSYFDGAFAMADVIRESQFLNGSWQDSVVDAIGAPIEDFLVMITSERLPAGVYKLSFTGRAELGIAASADDGSYAGAHLENLFYNAATNTTTADVVLPVNIKGNAWLSILNTRRTPASTSADGITDLHLWRPSYPTDGSMLFTREFIAAMKKFHVIRGMDFVSANSNDSVRWSDRPLMSHQGAPGQRGQPWELLVQLANATENDVWLNIPVQADDAYLFNLANLLRYGSDGVNPYRERQTNPVYPPLKPDIKVYLEYGNELWNSGPGFLGFGWSLNLATRFMGDPTHPIAYDSPQTDLYEAQRRWIAYRSACISLLFRWVFGDGAMMTRIRPILASQAGNGNAYLSEALKWAEGFYGQVRTSLPTNAVPRKVSDLWWGAGGAAYYDSDTPPTDASETTQAAYFAKLPNAEFIANTATDAVWARGYGLKSVAYEGGPGPGGSALGSASGSPALSAAYNADPRMATRMMAAHTLYQANGGQMLNYYVYSGAAPWDFINDLNPGLVSDTNTVKLQAITALRTTLKPATTLGTRVPGTVWLPSPNRGIQLNGGDSWRYNAQALRFMANTSASGKAFSGEALIPIQAPLGGRFAFSLTTYPEVDTQVELLVNGQSIGYWKLTGTCGGICNGSPVASPAISVNLPPGLSVVRLRPVTGWVWINNLVIQTNNPPLQPPLLNPITAKPPLLRMLSGGLTTLLQLGTGTIRAIMR